MKKMQFHLLLVLIIIFLVNQINQIGTEKKKLEQKSFDEIFGEKWEEKEKEKLEEKREIIQKFDKIKEKIKQKGKKYSTKELAKIDRKIAKRLGTNRDYIKKWVKQFGLQKLKSYKSTTDEEKSKIVQKFIKMTNEYKEKRKFSRKEWQQNYGEICRKIEVCHGTIVRWKKQFGIRCKLIEKEKIEKMKIYWQIKKENPKMIDMEIAKTLKISRDSITKWKKQFGEEMFKNSAKDEEKEE